MARSTALVAVTLLAACGSDNKKSASTTTTNASSATTTTAAAQTKIVVTSTAFDNNAPIPRQYTCKGENAIAPIAWSGIPPDAASVALVVDDPDAPLPGGFVHWVVLGLAPRDGAVPPVPPDARERPNGTGKESWTGPCPPPGKVHHYRFTVYALNKDVQARSEIKSATIAQTTLVGTYST